MAAGKGRAFLPAAMIGATEDLKRIIREQRIDLVVLAVPESRSAETATLVATLAGMPVKVYLVPDMLKMQLLNAEVERFGDLVVVGISIKNELIF